MFPKAEIYDGAASGMNSESIGSRRERRADEVGLG